MDVQLSGPLRAAVGNQATITVDARTIRELFRKLSEQYPDFKPLLANGVAVAINGNVYRDDWSTTIPENAEVVLLPRIQGG
ncbi:MAG: MoaD/ThiS family protein [Pseudomonadota bacterium]